MKRKLQEIIQEKFNYEETCLLLPDMDLRFSAVENEVFEGTFLFHSSSAQEVRGIVTCENPHVICETREFHGTEIQIRFQYHADAMFEGMSDQGVFVITSNVGEYLLPFRADITRHYLSSSIGTIKTLNDFTNLCKLNWEEALLVFKSPYFVNVLQHDNGYLQLLYRGLTQHGRGTHEMEEFLVGCGKKKRNSIRIARPERIYKASHKIQTDFLDIEKQEWGAINLEASCDASFIRLEKHQIGMYDFIGKHAELAYQIIPGKLHAGKNYGQITLKTAFQTEAVHIEVTLPVQHPEKSAEWKSTRLRAQMEQNYLEFCREKLTAAEWKTEMELLFTEAEHIHPDNEWTLLYRIYVRLLCGEKEEADRLSRNMARTITSQRTPLSAFYLYLTTIGETPSYIRNVTKRIREIYLKYPNHPVLIWILLRTDEALVRNPERKYQWLRKYMISGSSSPVFYEETAKLLCNHPELLRQFDIFERRVLVWMMKQGRLTSGLVQRIFAMAPGQKQFEPLFFQLLCRGYRMAPEEQAVRTICGYLIKCNQYGDVYFSWFQKGIAQHLKIAGLYEAYILSWNKANGMLPNEVLHYFSRNSSLPVKRKAMLYAHMVKNRNRLGKSWDAYLVLIRNFAKQELLAGEMNEDLAVIYEEVRRHCTKAEWDSWKKQAECCYRIRVMNDAMPNLHVLQAGKKDIQQVPVFDQGTYIYLEKKPFVVLYESVGGRLYTARDQFHLKKMLSGTHIYQKDEEPEQKLSSEPVTDSQSLKEQLELFAAPLSVMAKRIRKARDLGMDVQPYEEKLMLYMLFTGTFLPEHETVYQNLAECETEELLLRAYETWFSWQYMIGKEPLPQAVSVHLCQIFTKEPVRQKFCRAAFLKFCVCSGQNQTKEAWEIAERILKGFVLEQKSFAFYAMLPEKLQRKYLLFGCDTVTCVAVPGKYLRIYRKKQGQPDKTGDMKEVLPGIYSYTCREIRSCPEQYVIRAKDGSCVVQGTLAASETERWRDTRYGKLVHLSAAGNTQDAYQYAELTDLTDVLFQAIEE